MGRPGIMLYFDILEPIRVLSDADKGRLLVAMLEYGQFGTVPEFDGMLALAWGFVKPKIDKDEVSYSDSVMQRKYAAFCKKRWRLKLPKISFDEWLSMTEDERERESTGGNEPQRPVDFVASRYPTTATATATPTETATETATAAAAATPTTTKPSADFAAATAERKVKMMQGELGKGVVALSEYQIDILLDKLGIELFDYYVDKLSAFIIKNGARVKNHYTTILKWWEEDSEDGGAP